MGDALRWGIVGTGKIATIVAQALRGASSGALVAVASRSGDRAARFARALDVKTHHDGYGAVVEDPAVDVVYVATHHPRHCEWAIRAAQAGKHVVCEKPLAVNSADAVRIVDAARGNDVFLIEAFAYRCHPQTRRLVDLLRDEAIGEVRVIDAVFGYDAGPEPGNYLMAPELGGGSILDVGCYTTSMTHLVAAVATGVDVCEAVDVAGAASIGATGVDVSAAATLTFDGGPLARVACSIEANLESSLRVFGSEGSLTVRSPWLPGRIGGGAGITIQRRQADAEVIAVPTDPDPYVIEVDAINRFIAAGERSPSAMPWDESLANMRTLDRWRSAVGLRYKDDVI